MERTSLDVQRTLTTLKLARELTFRSALRNTKEARSRIKSGTTTSERNRCTRTRKQAPPPSSFPRRRESSDRQHGRIATTTSRQLDSRLRGNDEGVVVSDLDKTNHIGYTPRPQVRRGQKANPLLSLRKPTLCAEASGAIGAAGARGLNAGRKAQDPPGKPCRYPRTDRTPQG